MSDTILDVEPAASRMLAMTSSLVPPWDTQPGRAGTVATYPPSSSLSNITVYCIAPPFLPAYQITIRPTRELNR